MNADDWTRLLVALAAFLGGGGLTTLIVKRNSPQVDGATAKKIAQEAVSGEVETLLMVIAELRQSEASKAVRIDALEERIDKLEERERHMLTRAAVHEAWDQMAFQMLLLQNPQHPPPPPLTPRAIGE